MHFITYAIINLEGPQGESAQFEMVSMCSEKPIIMCSNLSLRSFPNVAFETVPVFV